MNRDNFRFGICNLKQILSVVMSPKAFGKLCIFTSFVDFKYIYAETELIKNQN